MHVNPPLSHHHVRTRKRKTERDDRSRRRHDDADRGGGCGGSRTGGRRVEEVVGQGVADGRLREDRFAQGRQGLQRGRRVRRQGLGQLRFRHPSVVRQQGGRRRTGLVPRVDRVRRQRPVESEIFGMALRGQGRKADQTVRVRLAREQEERSRGGRRGGGVRVRQRGGVRRSGRRWLTRRLRGGRRRTRVRQLVRFGGRVQRRGRLLLIPRLDHNNNIIYHYR